MKDACEYFNYIMTPGMTLSAQDLQMRELTLAFFDDEVRSRFSDKNIMEIAATTNKENKSIKKDRVWLEKYNKYLDELSDEESKDFYSVKTTRIQYWLSLVILMIKNNSIYYTNMISYILGIFTLKGLDWYEGEGGEH